MQGDFEGMLFPLKFIASFQGKGTAVEEREGEEKEMGGTGGT